MVAWQLWLAGVVAALWAQRWTRAQLKERTFRRRFPAHADGVIVGAEPRTYGAHGGRAILLLHGYNDSPQSLDQIARVLHAKGWTVRLPLLPGHGRSLRAFDSWTAEEVLTVIRDEYASLHATHHTVVVGGLSMGGALACWLAAETDVAAVILYAPMLFVPAPMQVAVSTARLWSVLTRYASGGGQKSIHDPEAQRRMIAYGCSTRRSLEAVEYIARGTVVRLGFVSAPTLVIQSEEDNRLPREQSMHAIARLGAKDRTVIWTRGAGHVLTVDVGWEQVAATTAEWLAARFPVTAAAGASPQG
ncbi:MAG: alpha/beta fold hydrolase [Gemmatimonadota bacterium]|nr:alpha/beta fold hydrolase [Gemmatimonadota bacterium]